MAPRRRLDAVEDVDQRQDFRLGYDGISVDGRFYLVCLGSDFNHHAYLPVSA